MKKDSILNNSVVKNAFNQILFLKSFHKQ